MKKARKTLSAVHAASLSTLRTQVRALRKELRRSQRLATLGTMTAMVAHEFNNILTPIVSYAQLAQNNPAIQARALRSAADSGRRASAICDAILGVARGAPAHPEEVCLRTLVERTITSLARDPRRDWIDLSVDVPEDLAIRVRPAELQQVLLNLLLNARHAVLARSTPRRIEVHAAADGDQPVLSVRDNGPGIPHKNLTKVFKPFFTTRASNGSGLGLAFCHRITRSLGGHIEVDSQPGNGATFSVYLPTHAPVARQAVG